MTQMDNGEVIPGLDEDWTFAGAKAMEWIAGLVALIIAQELVFGERIARSMPLLMMVWVGTTLGLATLRKRYPDQERGLRNHLMLLCGFAPPGIPTPAALQPYWSGCPVREINKDSLFAQLSLDSVLQADREEISTTHRG